MLEDRLYDALMAINHGVPSDSIEEALRTITRTDSPNLILNNRNFHKMITEGIDVSFRRDDRTVTEKVWLFDFSDPDNNDWLVVNQFTVVENHVNRRPDMVVFVNGLPLGVIELKNAADESADVFSAYNQLQTYKAQIPSLFTHNEVLLISDGADARVGSLSADFERFLPWRTIDGDTMAPSGFSTHRAKLKLQKRYYTNGWNRWEACYKYSHSGGAWIWYAAGTGETSYNSVQDCLNAIVVHTGWAYCNATWQGIGLCASPSGPGPFPERVW